MTEATEWKYAFNDLDKYEAGKEIKYTVTEDVVKGYSTEYDGNDIINSYTPGETSRTVTKIWDDSNNQDGIRPEEIRVQLTANGENRGEEVVLNKENNWTYTWSGLPEKSEGKTIEYKVKEVGETAGYTTSYSEDTFTITNSHETEKVNIPVEKVWKDNDNEHQVRPEFITVRLMKDGEEYKTVRLDDNNNWKYEFKELDKYEEGRAIEYTIREDGVKGYITEIEGYTITNREIVGRLEITKVSKGERTPEDTEFIVTGPDGYRKEIRYSEFKDGKYTLEGLKLGEYRVVESQGEIDGYVLRVEGNDTVVEIREESTTKAIEIENNYTETKTMINKLEATTSKPLAGAKLQIIDAQGKVIEEFISQEEAHTVTRLKAGAVYKLHEVTAPEGYEVAEDVEFTIKENGEVTYVTMIDRKKEEEPNKKVTELIINKVDQDMKALRGAGFELDRVVNGEEEFIEEQIGGPRFEFKGLEDGVYRIYEIEVPEGYEGLETYFEIEIREGKIYYEGGEETSFTVVNTNDGTTPYVLGDEFENDDFEFEVLGDEEDYTKPNKTVKTSDDQEMGSYIGLSVTSLALLFFLRKKRELKPMSLS